MNTFYYFTYVNMPENCACACVCILTKFASVRSIFFSFQFSLISRSNVIGAQCEMKSEYKIFIFVAVGLFRVQIECGEEEVIYLRIQTRRQEMYKARKKNISTKSVNIT